MSMMERLEQVMADRKRARNWQRITAMEAKDKLAEFTVLDVRQPHEFTGPLGHILGARLLPLPHLDEGLHTLDPDTPILVVCRSGGRSAKACSKLAKSGFSQVFNLEGGMSQWTLLRLPVVGGSAA